MDIADIGVIFTIIAATAAIIAAIRQERSKLYQRITNLERNAQARTDGEAINEAINNSRESGFALGFNAERAYTHVDRFRATTDNFQDRGEHNNPDIHSRINSIQADIKEIQTELSTYNRLIELILELRNNK